MGVIALAIGALAPAATLLTIEVLLATLFLSWLGFRLAGAFVAAPMLKPLRHVPPETLPTYSIIAALYREAASVDGLLRAIERLDYPPEKLDVILAVEADDEEAQAAHRQAHEPYAGYRGRGACRGAAHQTEGAERGVTLRTRQLHGDL